MVVHRVLTFFERGGLDLARNARGIYPTGGRCPLPHQQGLFGPLSAEHFAYLSAGARCCLGSLVHLSYSWLSSWLPLGVPVTGRLTLNYLTISKIKMNEKDLPNEGLPCKFGCSTYFESIRTLICCQIHTR